MNGLAELQALQAMLSGSGATHAVYLALLALVWLFKPERVASPKLFRASWMCFLLGMFVVLTAGSLVATLGMFDSGGNGLLRGTSSGVLAPVLAVTRQLIETLQVVAFACLFASLTPPAGAKRD